MNRKLLASNIGLVVLLVAGLAYVSLYLVRYDPLHPRYTIKVELARTGGLYFNSDVTYRGQPVGDVMSIEPRDGGVLVTVSVEPGVEIPADTRAVVAGLSPVGEQYLDFQPRSDDGPYLADGDTIEMDDTDIPVEFFTMMRHVALLAEQINPAPIRTVLNELTTAFGDPRVDLGRLIIDADRLLAAFEATQPDMIQLLQDGNVVLSTASALRPQLERFSREARGLTESIRSGRTVWRDVLEQVPPDLERVMAVLQGIEEPLATMIDSTDSVLALLASRGPALTELLTQTPPAASDFAQIVHGGRVHAWGNLVVTAHLCSYSDEPFPLPWLPSPPFDRDRQCPTRAPDMLQRGSYNAPHP